MEPREVLGKQHEHSRAARKAARELLVSTKRMKPSPEDEFGVPPLLFSRQEFDQTIRTIKTGKQTDQLVAIKALRQQLSDKEGVYLQDAIDAGISSVLIQFLSSSNSSLQLEAAWCLTSTTSSPPG